MLGHRERDADQFLDVAQEHCLLGVAQGNSHTRRSRPRRAPYPVHIRFRYVGKIEVDDVADAFHVDAAGSDVCSNERAHLACSELSQCSIPLTL